MKKKLFAVVVIVCVTASVILGTPVDDCDNGVPQPKFVDIVGCDVQPCTLKAGTTVQLLIDFTAPEPIDQLKAEVIAFALGQEVNFGLPQPNACLGLTNTHCPLEINEPARYKLEMPILQIYPPIPLTLNFYLKHNGGEEQFMCFKVQCKVSWTV